MQRVSLSLPSRRLGGARLAASAPNQVEGTARQASGGGTCIHRHADASCWEQADKARRVLKTEGKQLTREVDGGRSLVLRNGVLVAGDVDEVDLQHQVTNGGR